MELTDSLIKQGVLKTPNIIKAFQAIKRKDFVLPEYQDKADADIPLPIGFGQTISQPFTVAFMLELLKPRKNDIILDIGSGSGWTTALLAYMVGKKGKVYGIEVISQLKKWGEKNISQYNFIKKGIVQMFCRDGNQGLPEKAPFDKILVSAMAEEVPKSLKEQLKIGGRLVIPIQDSIILLKKESKESFRKKYFPGFVFVPFIKK